MIYSKHGAEVIKERLVSKSQRYSRKLFISLFKVVLVAFVFIIVVAAGAGFGMMKGILDNAPDINNISIKPKGFKSTIYNPNGTVSTSLSMINSNRIYVYYEDIPQDMINAFVAIEDERFWSHNGIDIRGIIRAAVRGIKSRNFDEGASTITQQLIKNQVFNVGMDETTFLQSLERKIWEQSLAIELEKKYTKKQILEYYLKDLDLKDFGLSDIEEITELDGNLPIYPLNDIILSQITKRSTTSQKLINLGLLTWLDILLEFHEIESKQSNLSRSQRELVKQRYNDISTVLADPKNGPNPDKPIESSGESGGTDD